MGEPNTVKDSPRESIIISTGENGEQGSNQKVKKPDNLSLGARGGGGEVFTPSTKIGKASHSGAADAKNIHYPSGKSPSLPPQSFSRSTKKPDSFTIYRPVETSANQNQGNIRHFGPHLIRASRKTPPDTDEALLSLFSYGLKDNQQEASHAAHNPSLIGKRGEEETSRTHDDNQLNGLTLEQKKEAVRQHQLEQERLERLAHEEAMRLLWEAHPQLSELDKTYLQPIQRALQNYNPAIRKPLEDIFTHLKRYGAGDIELLTAIAKRLFTYVIKVKKTQLADLQHYLRSGTSSDDPQFKNKFKAYRNDMRSCQRMIKRVLENKGMPPYEIPQKLKINPWMINSPYADLLVDKNIIPAEKEDKSPDSEKLKEALAKIGDLFERLIKEKILIPDVHLLDYEDLQKELDKLEDAPKCATMDARELAKEKKIKLPLAEKENLVGKIKTDTGEFIGGIFNSTNRTKNRALALVDFIWRKEANQNETQIISDKVVAPILARLAIGGRHCPTRAEDDTAWVLQKCQGTFIKEGPATLEAKITSILSKAKERSINSLVNTLANLTNGWGTPLHCYGEESHIEMGVRATLAPILGLPSNASSFEDLQLSHRLKIPVEVLFKDFNVYFTEYFVEELRGDILCFLNKTGPESIITYPDIEDYVARTSPERNLEGFIDSDELGLNFIVTPKNATRLLYGLGYFEEDNDDEW